MTDQYKELRQAALCHGNKAWAKQALQLLEEMDAVGAGGVSGKPLTNGGGLGWMKKLVEAGHGMPRMDLIPGEEMMIDPGLANLREWVDIINRADDDTKAILRAGLKEEIERMFARSIELVDDGEWMIHKGSRNPAIGREVEVICADGSMHRLPSNQVDWSQKIERRVVRYRMVK